MAMSGGGKRFADVVVAKLSGKPGDMVPPSADDEDEGDDDESKPGERGKIILAAQRRGDAEALEEGIKSLVRDCMKEYGVGGDGK